MLFVLSPAKTLDMAPANLTDVHITKPDFETGTAELLSTMKNKSASDFAKLMSISGAIAQLNVERYSEWDTADQKAAVLAFDGPAYRGLLCQQQPTVQQLQYLQMHLRILSGMYGLLRPLDQIKPHRLEMGTKLPNSKGPNLYSFWGEQVTAELNRLLDEHVAAGDSGTLVNCASQEYWKVVRPTALQHPVLHMCFPGPAVYAKQARGAMVRYAMLNDLRSPEQLKQFTGNEGEWKYDDQASTEHDWVFKRTGGTKANNAKAASKRKAASSAGAHEKDQQPPTAEHGSASTQPARHEGKRTSHRQVDAVQVADAGHDVLQLRGPASCGRASSRASGKQSNNVTSGKRTGNKEVGVKAKGPQLSEVQKKGSPEDFPKRMSKREGANKS